MRKLVYISILLFMALTWLQAEDYFFRHYSSDEGLVNPYIYSLAQDTSGYLWIGTGEGLFRFDGFDFELIESDSGMMNSFITSLHVCKAGRLFIGQQDGSISVYNKGSLSSLYIPGEFSGMVTGITEDKEGNCWISLQGGKIVRVSNKLELYDIAIPDMEENISGILHLHDDLFLIGTYDGLFIAQYSSDRNTMNMLHRAESFPGSRVMEMIKGPGESVYILSQDEGIFKGGINSSSGLGPLLAIDDNIDGSLDNLQSAVLTKTGVLWAACMGGGLLQYEQDRNGEFRKTRMLNNQNGLITNDISKIFLDDEGNLWLGSYGKGIMRYVMNHLSFHRSTEKDEFTSIWSLALHKKGLSAFGKGKCSLMDPLKGELIKEVQLKGLPRSENISASYMDPQGNMWLGTETSGLFLSPGASGQFHPIALSDDDLSKSVNHITGDEDNIWVSTKRGLCRIRLASQEKLWYSSASGLPHNNILSTCITSNGDVYIATICKDVHYIDNEGLIRKLDSSSMGSTVSIVSIAEGSNHDIWLATEGAGVWQISPSQKTQYSQEDGLISDYCYGIAIRNDRILVSHRGGLSLIDDERKAVRGFDKKDGLSSSLEFYRNALTSVEEQIWFGTSEGLVTFDLGMDDADAMAPKLNIKSVLIDKQEIEWTNGLITLGSGFHDLQVDYVGIHFNSPESVQYRTRLIGYGGDWSSLDKERTVKYSRLSHGDYTFQIEAVNASGVVTTNENVFMIHIRKPVYLLFWFWATIIIVITGIFVIILKVRERALKQQQAKLETMLKFRTREVVRQKERIEKYNTQTRESIRYASKIQKSIMPSCEEISDLLEDAFVFYRPHSVVSGDFYWVNEIDNGRILIVCADSTGHGIPGAFMSMIGITLIKDIVSHNPGIRPDRLLSILDKEVIKALSQKSDEHSLPDGMDLTVAILDQSIGQMEVSSAMNQFIIHTAAGPVYQSGTKLSIGGGFVQEKKVFENHLYKVSKGDRVYFFSDGYVDQFGGPRGKKYRPARFRTFIDEIHTLPMKKQLEKIEESFYEWKGNEEQIDDVLVLGFEI